MSPLIGITMSYDYDKKTFKLNQSYVEAIQLAGGVPVAVPPMEDKNNLKDIARQVDAIVFSGGLDINPIYYSEDPHPKLEKICPLRDTAEIFLVREMMKLPKPILGICRGMQVMNVAQRGSLFQDIPSSVPKAIKHNQDAPRYSATHKVRIKDPNSILYDIFKEDIITVNSYHHQSVKDIAPPFKVTALAPDGVIEAMELSSMEFFCLGVQWHPEEMCIKSPENLRIFEYLVEAARKQ